MWRLMSTRKFILASTQIGMTCYFKQKPFDREEMCVGARKGVRKRKSETVEAQIDNIIGK